MIRAPAREALALGHPEWQPWLRLYEEVRRALDSSTWASVVRNAAPPADAAPLLADATIAIDVRRAGRFLRDLLGAAAVDEGPTATLDSSRLSDDDALVLLGAGVAEDRARIGALATTLGADSGALGAVAALGAMPVLHACRRALAGAVPASWVHGYCPLCGAWPTLAEARGVERTRRFRCARCGGEWHAAWLRCPYCGNADHTRLAALVCDASGMGRHVDTCEVCLGYVKTLTVLQATPAAEIALADLTSVELDVAALENGYRRPTDPARALATRVVAAQ